MHNKESASMSLETPDSATAIIQNAAKLGVWLQSEAAGIETAGLLPNHVVGALMDAGVFRMTMPKVWGGPELNSMEQVKVLEAVAYGDVASAWCGMTGSDAGIYSGYLEDAVARDLYPHLDVVQAGWVYPGGIAEEIDGAYKVSGQWQFCSGSGHADVIAAGCIVHENGQPKLGSNGRAEWRILLAPADHWHIQDTWRSTGLKGTASQDYTTLSNYLIVPKVHSFSFDEPQREGLLWQLPDTYLRNMSGVPLGLAKRVIDEFSEIMNHKVHPSRGAYKQLPRVQAALADAQMQYARARSYVMVSLEKQWHILERTGTMPNNLSNQLRADIWLSRLNAFQMARDVTSLLYGSLGSDAVYTDRTCLDRALRDANTMCQHWVAQAASLESVGEMLLDVTGPSPRSIMM